MYLANKIRIAALLIVAQAMLIAGCKKNDDPPDYAAMLRKQPWSGEYQQATGAPGPRPIQLEFGADNSVILYDISGAFNGSYSLSGQQVTFEFGVLAAKFSAMLKDNKLSEFVNIKTHPWVMLRASANPIYDQSLDNTEWAYKNSTGANVSALKFVPGAYLFYMTAFNGSYSRQRAAITGTLPGVLGLTRVFCVIFPDNTIRFVDNAGNTQIATKL